ncbi:unnamed protein product [Rhizophagus irregularis]|nr:unnamed protein product [Rhizophagus irregularis]
MKRIKFSDELISLLTELFLERKNKVFTPGGLTEEYDVQCGIDQEEIISPLLWIIYYDPLLSKIKNSNLGYNIDGKKVLNLYENINERIEFNFPGLSYMDDTNFIAENKADLEKILAIADSFYNINDIKINKDKSELLWRAKKGQNMSETVEIKFGNKDLIIKPADKKGSIRILGVCWQKRREDHLVASTESSPYIPRCFLRVIYNSIPNIFIVMTPLKTLPSLGKKTPSDVSISKPHVTCLNKDGHNKKPLHKIRNIFAYSFQTHKLNPYIVSDTRGSGTLYNMKKSRYFLMELDPNVDLCLTKKNSFNVYTNDIDMLNDHQRIFNSTSKKINLNYLMGTYLAFIFSINRQFSPDTVKKYFKRLRQLLINKLVAIKNRLSHSAKNRQTKTYIRFSSGSHVIYLGFYFRCSRTCTQPAAFVLPHNQWKCNEHFSPLPGSRLRTQRSRKDFGTPNFNQWKEVRSTRLGLKYHTIVKRYNDWKGRYNPNLKSVMEPITTVRKGKSITKPFYKEYKNVEFDDNRTPQQIKRWKRLKESILKYEEHLYHCKPFLLKENSTVFKKITHLVERDPLDERSEDDKFLDQLTRKRAKRWRRRINNRNKLRKKLPILPPDFSGDARNYYFETYNINLFAYKVRRRYDLSNIRQCQYGYLKAKRLHNNYMERKKLRPPVRTQPSQSSELPPPEVFEQRVTYLLPEEKAAIERDLAARHYDSTTFKIMAPLLLLERKSCMIYPSAKEKEKARLNALANSDISLSNSNQSTDVSFPRPIARPGKKREHPYYGYRRES